MAMLRCRALGALVNGDGVEQQSRQALLTKCAGFGPRPVETFGLDRSRQVLQSLS